MNRSIQIEKCRKSLSILMIVVMLCISTLGSESKAYGAKTNIENLTLKINSEDIINTIIATNGEGITISEDETDIEYEGILVSEIYSENLDGFLVINGDILDTEEGIYISEVKNPVTLYKNDKEIKIKDYTDNYIVDLAYDIGDNNKYSLYKETRIEIASSIESLELILVNKTDNIEYNIEVELDEAFSLKDKLNVRTDKLGSDSNSLELTSTSNIKDVKGTKAVKVGTQSNETGSNIEESEGFKINLKPGSVANVTLDVEFERFNGDEVDKLVIHNNININYFNDNIVLDNEEITLDNIGIEYRFGGLDYRVIDTDNNIIEENSKDTIKVMDGYTIEVYGIEDYTSLEIIPYLESNKIEELFDINIDKVINEDENELEVVLDISVKRDRNIIIEKNIDVKNKEIFLYTIEKLDEPGKGNKYTIPMVVEDNYGSIDLNNLYHGKYRIAEERHMRYSVEDIESTGEIVEIEDSSITLKLEDDCVVKFIGSLNTNKFLSKTETVFNRLLNIGNRHEFVMDNLDNMDEQKLNTINNKLAFMVEDKFNLEIRDIEDIRLA